MLQVQLASLVVVADLQPADLVPAEIQDLQVIIEGYLRHIHRMDIVVLQVQLSPLVVVADLQPAEIQDLQVSIEGYLRHIHRMDIVVGQI